MEFKNRASAKFLEQFGWSSNRKVGLPTYIDTYSTPPIVISIIENLYGLEFVSLIGNERNFTVDKAFIKDFNADMQEWVEDTGVEFQFYPLGHMAEHGGILVLDHCGRFFLAGDELIYYGDNLEQFVDVVLFKRRSGISIRNNGSTRFCYNNKDTGYIFDNDKGWLGEQEHLSLEYIKSQENT